MEFDTKTLSLLYTQNSNAHQIAACTFTLAVRRESSHWRTQREGYGFNPPIEFSEFF